MWQRLTGGGGGGGDDDSGSSSSSSSSSSSDSSNDSGGGGGFFGGISDAVDDAADTVTDTVSDTVDDVTGGGSSSGGSSSRSRGGRSRSSRSSSSSSSNDGGGGGGGGGGFFGGISDAGEDAMQGIEDTVDRADDAVDDTVDRAQDTARDTARDVSRGVDRTVDRAEDTVDDTVDRATDTVEDTANRAERTVDNTVDRAQDTARDVSRDVDRTVDQATDTADDVASNVSRSAGEVAGATRDQVDHAAETYGEIGRELQGGDVGAAVDTAVESTGETYDNLARAGDAAAGSTDEYVGSADVNTEVTDDLTRGGLLSENRNDNSGLLPGEVGGVNLSEQGLRSAAGDINDVKKSFDENDPVTAPVVGNAPERVLQGAAGAGVDFLNFPQHALMLETGAEVAQNAPGEIQEHGVGEVAETATGVGAMIGGAMAQDASNNPIEFTSGLGMDIITGAGVGAAAKKGFVHTRGAMATRGIPDSRKVDFGDIQRSDVESGQSRLTRHSESAVGSDKKHAMDDGDFPVDPANDPATELQRLSDEHTTPEIESALDVQEGENVLYHATGRTKGETYEARSYRDYDPDAMYFAGSVSKNFLPDAGNPEISPFDVSLRRPKPVKAAKSLFNDENPTVVASAGEIDTMPGDAKSRGDVSEFLKENTNNNRFYVQDPESGRQSGEAEALVGAHADLKENPDPGAGIISEGEGTEFVNLNDPLQTEIRGEPVRIQTMRQRGYQEGGETTLPDGQESYTPDELADSLGSRGSPGGASGTPVVPMFGLGGAPGAGGPLNVDETGLSTQDPTPSDSSGSPGSPDGPLDELGGFDGFDGFDNRSPDTQTPSDPPSSDPNDYGPEWSDNGFLDERGPSSPPSSTPDSDGPGSSPPPSSPPLDEFGPTSPPTSFPPTSDPPSSQPPSSPPLDEFGPTSPPGSAPPSGGGPTSPPGSGGPSSPPGSPPPWSPPGGYDGGGSSSTSSPPGSPGGPGGSGSGFGPSPFDPTDQQRRRDFDDERKKEEEEFTRPAYGVFDVDFQNPIASGAEVLGFGFGGGGALDESGGLQDAGGFGDELSQGGPIDESGGFGSFGQPFDESGGFGSFGQPIDETGGLDDWTPF